MPLWQIYHPNNTFNTVAEKQALSRDITQFYTNDVGLPAFYVVVQFIKLHDEDVWVGGEHRTTKNPFVRIVINHIAVSTGVELHDMMTSRFDQILKPYIADNGFDWEYHVGETERGLWKINGLAPPPYKSEVEKLWAKENRPIP